MTSTQPAGGRPALAFAPLPAAPLTAPSCAPLRSRSTSFLPATLPAAQVRPPVPARQRTLTRAASSSTPPTSPPPTVTDAERLAIYFRTFRQNYFDLKRTENAIVADNSFTPSIDDIVVRPFMLFLDRGVRRYGSLYKFAAGPRAFYIVSDPVIARHILRDNADLYDKGILAEVLEPIMGKGLIPADFETWKQRRRAILPAFHIKWLQRMVTLFGECAQVLVDRLDQLALANEVVNMEEKYCSVGLDIIGKAVFNYDFGSVTRESPIIKAVYRLLRESEHRSMFIIPYWKDPILRTLVPRQRLFTRDMKIMNDTLDALIQEAVNSKSEADLEDLERRDYDNVNDPSLLRFLVDLRGEEATCSQLRDDLMTLLIAGHETTAAVLTWSTFLLAQHPDVLQKVRDELDEVLGDRSVPTYDDMKKLRYLRLVLAETLRLYPAPPLLIRRALADDLLPKGASESERVLLYRGAEVFISVWSMHRSPQFWENPEVFDPDRFNRPFENPGVQDWKGYVPGREGASSFYPNEVSADFAFLPFGGGSRKCIGDQFAMMESIVVLAMVLRKFDFSFPGSPVDVGMTTGATIHTANGLNLRVRKRSTATPSAVEAQAPGVRSEQLV